MTRQFRVGEQAGGHPEALAHAHRVRGHFIPGPFGQTDPGQRRRDPLVRVPAPCGGQQAKVVPAGQVRVEAGLVDDRPDPGQGRGPLGRDGGAEQRHRAGIGPGEAEQGADQGGLARAVRAEVAEGGAARDEQLDVVDRDGGPEPFAEAVGLDRPSVVRARRRRPRAWRLGPGAWPLGLGPWRLGPGYRARLAVEAHPVREAYRAVAQRAEYQEGQDDQPDADVPTMCAHDDGPGGQKLVGVHRSSSWPSGDAAVIVRAGYLGVIPEDDAGVQAVVTRPDS